MTPLLVDREKCTGDGICAYVCPVRIIKTPDPNGGCPKSVSGAVSTAVTALLFAPMDERSE